MAYEPEHLSISALAKLSGWSDTGIRRLIDSSHLVAIKPPGMDMMVDMDSYRRCKNESVIVPVTQQKKPSAPRRTAKQDYQFTFLR